MTAAQQLLLVTMRTLIGWHFLFEGYVKLATPGWGPDGQPMAAWSSAAYLSSATGPLAGFFHSLAASPSLRTIDLIVAIALVAVGIGLMLGLTTQTACAGGIVLLSLFYLASIPTSGLPGPRLEGTYLLVNKNLIELAAVAVLFAFRTGRIAGLDRMFVSRAATTEARSTGAAA
jgi:thiosulfate dehydrogenase (quinone) large subunit